MSSSAVAAGVPTLSITAPPSAIADRAFDVNFLLVQGTDAIADAEISVTASLTGQADVVATGTTNDEGLATVSLVLPVRGGWTINASYVDANSNTFAAEAVRVVVGGQGVSVVMTAPSSRVPPSR